MLSKKFLELSVNDPFQNTSNFHFLWNNIHLTAWYKHTDDVAGESEKESYTDNAEGCKDALNMNNLSL